MCGGPEGLFGQTVVFKRSSVRSLQSRVRVPLVLFPRHPRPPAHREVSRYPFYHFASCVPLARAPDSDLQLRKQPSLGLVCCPSRHSRPPFIGSRARCLFSLHCWGKRDGGVGGTLVLPVSGACKGACEGNISLCTQRTGERSISQNVTTQGR